MYVDEPSKHKNNVFRPSLEMAQQDSNPKKPLNKTPSFKKADSSSFESRHAANSRCSIDPYHGIEYNNSLNGLEAGECQSVEDSTLRTEDNTLQTEEASCSVSMTRSDMFMFGQNSGLNKHSYVKRLKEEQHIGRGQQANVFLVNLPGEGLAAVKRYELIKGELNTIKICENLNNEFVMLKNIEHRNIIRYKYLYQPKRHSIANCIEFGIIMEYMEGGPLDTYIDKVIKEITIDKQKSLIKQILEGLDVLHDKGIAHRDLKVNFSFKKALANYI
jgi:predicted Ser/Thr protein kinase